MKWEDVIQACEILGYTPEDLVKLIQVHERGKEYSFVSTDE